MDNDEVVSEASLSAEVARLRDDVERLRREKSELEVLMEMNIEHSDFVEDELLQNLDATRHRLRKEIAKLRQEIHALHQRIRDLQCEKTDLELLVKLNVEHADFIEEDLLNKIESTIRDSERQFRLISETVPVPILVNRIDNLEIVFANEPAHELLSTRSELLIGQHIARFYRPEDVQTIRRIMARDDVISQYEMPVQRLNGHQRWVLLSARSLMFDARACVLTALYDMTERKQAEQEITALNEQLEYRVSERTIELQHANQALQESLDQLRLAQNQLIQAEKSVALAGLVAGIAHEINNPIGIGVTSASYLDQQTRDIVAMYTQDTMTRSALEHYFRTAQESSTIILRNLQRAAEQIKSFKQVAVDQTISERRPFAVKDYLDELMLTLYPKFKHTRHTITVECPEEIVITSYPGVLSQILTNLVINSLMHGFERQEQGDIRITVSQECETLYLDFRDNGRGMTVEECSRAFDAFYTTKRGQGGSGLGLHIVYNLVTQKLGGTIACDSSPGTGTIFRLCLPLLQTNNHHHHPVNGA